MSKIFETLSKDILAIAGLIAAIVGIFTFFKNLSKNIVLFKIKLYKFLDMPDVVATMQETQTQKIKTLEKLTQITVMVLDIPIYECDSRGFCTNATPAICTLFGLTREEMLGQGWLKAIKDDDMRDRAWQDWKTSIDNQLPYTSRYTIINQKTHKEIHVWTRAEAIISESTGLPTGYIGYMSVTQEEN